MEELEFGIKDVGAQLLPQVLHYYGEGQRGNQRLTDGNKAVLEHEESGRALRVFQGARGSVRYLGEFRLDEDEPYYETQAPATRGGPMRNALVFKLRPLDFLPDQAPTISGVGFSTPYRDADENASSAPAEPFRTDPNAVDRSNQAHARLQNLLANYAQTRGAEILSPGSLDPDFDVAWKLEETIYLAEVKSLTSRNEVGQLRLGLGQILHYGGWAWWLWLLCASSWNPLSSCRSGALETRDGLGRRSVELSGLVSRPSTGSTVVGVCFAGASKVFERFRRGAREAVKLAQEQARSLGHNYIEPSTCFWGY